MEYQYFILHEGIGLDELKQQYRKLAQQYHPDKGGEDETFKQVQEEYKKALEEIREKAYRENDVNLYKIINEHLYRVDNYIYNLNIPEPVKPALSYLAEKGINELAKIIKHKLK